MPIDLSVERVLPNLENRVNEQVSRSLTDRCESSIGFPFTYILIDGQAESIVNNIKIHGIGVTRPVANTSFRIRMGSELYFIEGIFADLLDEMASLGVWGSMLVPTNAVMYEFRKPIILTPGSEILYQTVLGTNGTTPKMNCFLRGEIISEEEARRSLTYLKVFELNTTTYTSIRFPRDVYILNLLFFDILDYNSEYTIINPLNVPDYNKLAAYIFEIVLKKDNQVKHALSYGIDRWCNYSVSFIHKKINFKRPPLIKTTEQLLMKMNPSTLGTFTAAVGTWKPQVLVEYKIAPGEYGTYV